VIQLNLETTVALDDILIVALYETLTHEDDVGSFEVVR
jgi:hypothetical protein